MQFSHLPFPPYRTNGMAVSPRLNVFLFRSSLPILQSRHRSSLQSRRESGERWMGPWVAALCRVEPRGPVRTGAWCHAPQPLAYLSVFFLGKIQGMRHGPFGIHIITLGPMCCPPPSMGQNVLFAAAGGGGVSSLGPHCSAWNNVFPGRVASGRRRPGPAGAAHPRAGPSRGTLALTSGIHSNWWQMNCNGQILFHHPHTPPRVSSGRGLTSVEST